MSIPQNVERAKNDYDRAYAAGKQAEYDAFWDGFQLNGTRPHYLYGFAYEGWDDTLYKPKYDIKGGNESSLGYLYYYSRITDTLITIDAEKCYASASLFNNAKTLKTIRKVIVGEDNRYANWFLNCYSLENLTIEGTIGQDGFSIEHSTKLSKASIISIINALSATTTGLTVTLSQTAVNAAFATTEGGTDGSTSAEWLALAATKSNWTIALA